MTLRPGQDDDAPAFIALIERCWSDYPGCVLDLDGEVPELRALATYYRDQGGALWIEHSGAGMIATRPHPSDATIGDNWEICRVYVHPDRHGSGLAQTLLATAEHHALRRGATRLFLWSDTRFTRAHRFYEKHGYQRTGAARDLHDLAHTTEYQYEKLRVSAGA